MLCTKSKSEVRLAFLSAAFVVSCVGYAAASEQHPVEVVPQVGHSEPITSVRFSPNGKQFVSTDNRDPRGLVRIWDTRTGRLVRLIRGYYGKVHAARYSRDGAQIIALGEIRSARTALRVWDPVTGKQTSQDLINAKRRASNFKKTVAVFSPNQSLVATGETHGKIKIWRAKNGRLVRTLNGHQDRILTLDFSPNGELLLTGSLNEMGDHPDTLRLWDVKKGLTTKVFNFQTSVWSAEFSPDGSKFIVGSSDGTRLFDTKTKELVWHRKVDGWVNDVAFSHDGSFVVSGGENSNVTIRSRRHGKLISTYPVHTGEVHSVDVSRDGMIVSGGGDGIRLWEASTGKLIRFEPSGKSGISSIGISADGNRIVTADGYGLRVWDVKSGKVAWTRRMETVTAVDISPNGKFVVFGTEDGSVNVWDLQTRKLTLNFNKFQHAVRQVAFIGDGTIIEAGDHRLKVSWRLDDGHELSEKKNDFFYFQDILTAESIAVKATVYGRMVVVSSIVSNRKLASFYVSPTDDWFTVTPEGFFDASKNGAELLNVVRGLEVYSINQFYQALYRPDLVKAKLAGDPEGKVLLAADDLNLAKILDTGAPPAVTIVSPKPGQLLQSNTITVEVAVNNEGGGIGRVEFRVKKTGDEDQGVNKGDGVSKVVQPGKSVTVRKELELASETTTIEVIAYNKKDQLPSRPVSVKVTVDKAVIEKYPTLYVLAIGANEYVDSQYKLNYTLNDIDGLTKALTIVGQEKSPYRDVKIVPPLLDGDVTKEKISQAFLDLSKVVKAHDVFLFFISGHGKTIGGTIGKYFFIPPKLALNGRPLRKAIIQDAISQDDWRTWLSQIKANKSLLIFDTCEAGDLTEIVGRGFGEDQVAAEKLSRATGRALLTASGPRALALEGYKKHGILTYALLEGLAVADKNGDGVQLRELFDHVGERVPQISRLVTINNANFTDPYEQTPGRLLRGDDFRIAAKPVTGVIDLAAPDAKPIPTKPTHVVIKPANLYEQAEGQGKKLQVLKPGALLTLIETKNGRMLVARDGKRIGYLSEEQVLRIH